METEPTQGWGIAIPYWHGRSRFLLTTIHSSREQALDDLLERNRHRVAMAGIESRANRLRWLRRNGYRVVRVRLVLPFVDRREA